MRLAFDVRRTGTACLAALCAFAGLLLGGPATAVENGTAVSDAEVAEKGLVLVNLPGGGSCSGVLMANDWVMTAGHCAIQDRLAPANLTVTFLGTPIAADAIYLFGGFTDEVGPDLALMHLQAPFAVNGSTTGFSTPIWGGDPAALQGMTVATYGAGHNACPLAGAGTYRANDVVVSGEFEAIGQPNNPAAPPTAGNFTPAAGGRFYSLPNTFDAAGLRRIHLPGDSGGPSFIFVDGARQLVGITSGSDACAGGSGIVNNVVRLRPWIEHVFKTRWVPSAQTLPVFVFPDEVAGTRWDLPDVNQVHWAQAARAAAAMCYNRGFAGGHFDGHQGPFQDLGSGFGIQCSGGDTLWRDVTTADMDPNWSFSGDINQVTWAQAGRAAQSLCAGFGYAGGQFNGHQRDGRYGLFCYRGGAKAFDAADQDLAATGWGFDLNAMDQASWAQAGRAATDFCRSRGFSGGFMNGHHVPGLSGMVCQG